MNSTSKNVLFVALGTLIGSVGLKVLCSKDAKKVYTHVTAAGLRAKDSVMKTVSTVQENVDDILADAKAINAERAAKEAAETVDLDADAEEEAEANAEAEPANA